MSLSKIIKAMDLHDLRLLFEQLKAFHEGKILDKAPTLNIIHDSVEKSHINYKGIIIKLSPEEDKYILENVADKLGNMDCRLIIDLLKSTNKK